MVKIAINGFGRIGRCAFKIALDRRDTEIVAINNRSGSPELFSHLIKYDTIYGIYNREVSFDKNNIIIDGKPIRFFNESDPTNLPWKELDVDVVLECTGAFTDPAKAKAHLKSGAKKVVISAPAKGKGAKTIVIGANDYELTEDDKIISCASCTTNCIAPVMKVLEDKIGIKKAMMTTVHSYTPSQSLSDSPSKSFRLSRAATENIIPSTTGASKTTALTIPSLTNKFDGLSIRVPTPTVPLCDLVAVTKRKTSIDEINNIFRQASKEAFYEGILISTDEELVSSDYIGNAHSCIVDLPLTNVVDEDLIKIVAWYDNEWGYSNRLVELSVDAAKMRPLTKDSK